MMGSCATTSALRIGTAARLLLAGLLGLAALTAAIGGAAACEGAETLFEDSFEDDSGGWALNDAVVVKDGDFTFDLAPDGMQANLNISHTVEENVDICADTVWPKEQSSILGAGLLFWGEDAKNYFQYGILNNGKYWIARKQNGKWQVIVQNATSGKIKTGPGARNTLRVQASGDHVSFFINDEKVRELRGQQPSGGWRFGLSGDNFDKQAEEKVVFSSIKVTN